MTGNAPWKHVRPERLHDDPVYWIADGYVWIDDGIGVVRIAFAAWNAMIGRVGERREEADRRDPP